MGTEGVNDSIVAGVMFPSLSTAQLAVAIAGAAAALLAWSNRSRNRLPPGPKGYPLIGSLLAWPTRQAWLTFTQWRKTYGDIVYANVAGTHFVVLNSLHMAKALLDDGGAIYADRPHQHFLQEIVGWKNSPAMCKLDHPFYKPARRMMYSAVGSRAALEGYMAMEQHEVHRFLRRAIDDPECLSAHLRKLAGTIIMRLVYGYDVKPGDDEYVDLVEKVIQDVIKAVVPGNYMVDLIPALSYVPRWFPGTGWKVEGDRMRATLDEALSKPINFVKGQLAAGVAQASFVGSELMRPDWDEQHEGEVLAWTAESLYSGGADTSVASNYTFFLCMTLFPDVQSRAQEEIDRVIGPDVLPTWDDRERLPYVEALMKEVFRWAPVGPLAIPHCASTEGTFRGYVIPRGTVIIPNVWGITRDAAIYPDPERFDPARFLGDQPQMDPGEYTFGFGRRACPGRQLAEVSLFLVIATSLATLNVSKKIGRHGDGQPIVPTAEYLSDIISHPAPFECDIKPRNNRAESLIRAVHDAPFGH